MLSPDETNWANTTMLDQTKALARVLAVLRSMGVQDDNIDQNALRQTLRNLPYLTTMPGEFIDRVVQSDLNC